MKVWAVVPVKPFARAKQRLEGALQPWERLALSRLMLRDTLQALARVRGLAGCLVVTADSAAGLLARSLGAEVLDEGRPQGLNAAVSLAARWVQHHGGQAMLVVPGDVPGLKAAELAALIDAHADAHVEAQAAARAGEPGLLSLVPAHDGDGTNAWLLSPPQALAPAFGPGSFQRHQRAARAAGLGLQCRALPSLGLDLDHVGDLACFASEPHNGHTGTASFLVPRLARLEALAGARTAA